MEKEKKSPEEKNIIILLRQNKKRIKYDRLYLFSPLFAMNKFPGIGDGFVNKALVVLVPPVAVVGEDVAEIHKMG